MIQRACACGAAMRLSDTVSPLSAKAPWSSMILEEWSKVHTGPGHEPVTMAEAQDIRRALTRPGGNRNITEEDV